MDRKSPEQLPLALPSVAAMGREDFLEAPSNALALAALDDPRGLPGGLAVLVGPEGSGKTHLARVWAAATSARWQPAGTLREDLPDLLAPGAPLAVAIDDADALAGTSGEEALFHLVNHLRGRGMLLLTARLPVRDWGIRLPDLLSRLSAAAHPGLAEPDEALLAAVLVKLFADRQVQVDPGLIDFLLPRMERSLAAARSLVQRLDRRALQLKRPITARLAGEVLAEDLDNGTAPRAS
ncbi:MAG: chromosomal replication initiator DnaA [Rhodobacteraceae bacterium]|nr:chromosomal replication initiator DnaA [Paracoccaceae bacterium]